MRLHLLVYPVEDDFLHYLDNVGAYRNGSEVVDGRQFLWVLDQQHQPRREVEGSVLLLLFCHQVPYVIAQLLEYLRVLCRFLKDCDWNSVPRARFNRDLLYGILYFVIRHHSKRFVSLLLVTIIALLSPVLEFVLIELLYLPVDVQPAEEHLTSIFAF